MGPANIKPGGLGSLTSPRFFHYNPQMAGRIPGGQGASNQIAAGLAPHVGIVHAPMAVGFRPQGLAGLRAPMAPSNLAGPRFGAPTFGAQRIGGNFR